MLIKYSLLYACLVIAGYSHAQDPNPAIRLQRSFGGSGFDQAQSIQQTTDGGYIVAGYTDSNDGDVTGHHGGSGYFGYDYWIMKFNSKGIIQWQKALGGTSTDYAKSVQQTKDGGYIVAGATSSKDGDVTGYHGHSSSTKLDYWIVKLNAQGNIQWQKCLGGTGDDEARNIQQTKDGGYIIAGASLSTDGDVTGNHGDYDYWIVKLDSSGTVQWQKSYGGTKKDYANSCQQTNDGGYIVAGYSESGNGDVRNNKGGGDYWLVKLDSTGMLFRQACFGGSQDDYAHAVQQTADGGCVIAGYSYSNDGDVTGNHGAPSLFSDYWVIKLNRKGAIQWQKALGGTSLDEASSIKQTPDGGYIVAGYSASQDGDVTGHHGASLNFDYWIVKLSGMGNIQSQVCLGGGLNDYANSIETTTDGSCIMAGRSESNDGDVSGNHGNADFWIVKFRPFPAPESATINSTATVQESNRLVFLPNPSNNGIFTTNLGAVKNNIRIKVTDNTGRQVYAKKLSSAQQVNINLNNQPKGIYHVYFLYDGGIQTEKLMIE